jgi:hypothetical protein
VIASSAAILLWSWAILAHARLSRVAGVFGAIIGVVVLAATTIGHLRLDVHGFGAVVLLQGFWLIAVGVLLTRSTHLSESTS